MNSLKSTNLGKAHHFSVRLLIPITNPMVMPTPKSRLTLQLRMTVRVPAAASSGQLVFGV